MSTMTRFVLRALPTLVGFIIGAFVGLVIVSLLGVYGTLATVVSIAAGLGLAYLGFRIGWGIIERRERGAYMDPGYPPREHDQTYRQPSDQQGYGYQRQGYPGERYGDYPPYQG